MKNKIKLGVIIATSMARTEKLFSLSLDSVLKQTQSPDYIVIVDDNTDEKISAEIKERIASLNNPLVEYTKNTRTRGMSGTGAWNTGIDFISKHLGEDSWIAILDDDDSWNTDYIENIRQKINEKPNADAVFAFLKRSDCEEVSSFAINDLTIEKFLIGNPGIQGSNMCFKTEKIKEIAGFDENLASCTDRDLMIKFLQKNGNDKISLIEKRLVNHFAGKNTVTSNFGKKEKGLDYFYRKHIGLYDFPTLVKSLERAQELFGYQNSEKVKKLYLATKYHIVIGVAIHNNAKTIRRCLLSILNQKQLARKIKIILADDNSSDNWQTTVSDLLADKRIEILHFSNNNVVKTRNAINDYIVKNIKDTALIGRLDADDEYSGEFELSKIEKILDEENPDAILAGNYLRQNNVIIARTNIADSRLKSTEYILFRLKQMSMGMPEGELPSCNLFVTPQALRPYPNVASGEDHHLLVHYLINQDNYKVFIAEDLLPVIYHLGGIETSNNKKTELYLNSRIELYQKTMELCKTKTENKKH